MAFMAVSLEKEEKSGDVQLQKKSFEINNASLQIRSNGELRDFLKANFNIRLTSNAPGPTMVSLKV